MKYFSPSPHSSNGGRLNDLKDLSPDELISHVEELEEQLDSLRRRHEIELRRGGGESRSSSSEPFTPTHTHADGYDVVSHQRVAVLIDVQNMYYAARNLYNSKLEFSKLLRFLIRGRQLSRAIAYIVERPGMEQEKFVEVLRRNGYEVRKKILIERSDGSQKGDWDLGIALDAVALSDKVDAVVLVTGDGDFVNLVSFLMNRGVRVEIASFPETTALELIRSCSYYHRLNDKVLLSGAQFQERERTEGEPERTERHEEDDLVRESRGRTPGPRPGRSPVDDLELDDDDDFDL
ncbi:MAG: NYN domain-containing protein [Planctomycetes bacterium]|nr:NYN domain-containing protein [Planctomycetota bacterium]